MENEPLDDAVGSRFWAKTRKAQNGCLVWVGAKSSKGYGRFSINGTNKRANRIAYVLSKGPIPPGLFVLHECDNPSCVNPDHLFLGTNADNMRDMAQKGRACRASIRFGSRHPFTSLSEDDVRHILSSPAQGRFLAKKYRISDSAVSLIRSRKTWRHVVCK